MLDGHKGVPYFSSQLRLKPEQYAVTINAVKSRDCSVQADSTLLGHLLLSSNAVASS